MKSVTQFVSVLFHTKDQHEMSRKNHKCSICAKIFFNKHGLKLHMDTHSGNKPFKCTFCDMSMTLEHNLKKHIYRVHIGYKKTSCKICNKQLSPESLKEHMNSHTGTYCCNICSQRFNNWGTFNRHKVPHNKSKSDFECLLDMIASYNG